MQVFVQAFSMVNFYVFVDIFVFSCVIFAGALIKMVLEWCECEHEADNNDAIEDKEIIDSLRAYEILKYFRISTMHSQ